MSDRSAGCAIAQVHIFWGGDNIWSGHGNQQQGDFGTRCLRLSDFDGILPVSYDSISRFSPPYFQDRRKFRIIPSLEDPGVLH